MTRLSEYVANCDGVDWADLLESWTWLLPTDFTVWFANRFGDLFLVFDDGSVHVLDVGVGELRRLADDRDQFAALIDENADDWLMIPLVDQLMGADIRTSTGECYGYVRLPLLGGDYTVENTCVVALADIFKALGPAHERMKDLPDGTGVILKRGAV